MIKPFKQRSFLGHPSKANDLNFNFDQVLYLAQETANISNAASANVGTANTNASAAVATAKVRLVRLVRLMLLYQPLILLVVMPVML
jgi:hypothetical protein